MSKQIKVLSLLLFFIAGAIIGTAQTTYQLTVKDAVDLA